VHLCRNLLTLQLFEAKCGVSGAALDSQDGQAAEQTLLELASLQLENWISAIRRENVLAVSAEEAMRSIALVEDCYARRRLWELPWVSA